tara:strand:+ start:355 stop:570 length:216 start_codon:yes stop_codon:yes gene_type:complete
MKPIMITLLYLTFSGDIKQDTFEIFTSCSSWFNTNITTVEKKKKTFMSNHFYHTYKGKKVIGYICGGDEPQ